MLFIHPGITTIVSPRFLGTLIAPQIPGTRRIPSSRLPRCGNPSKGFSPSTTELSLSYNCFSRIFGSTDDPTKIRDQENSWGMEIQAGDALHPPQNYLLSHNHFSWIFGSTDIPTNIRDQENSQGMEIQPRDSLHPPRDHHNNFSQIFGSTDSPTNIRIPSSRLPR